MDSSYTIKDDKTEIFEILEVPNDVAKSAKIMYPEKFIIPQCYIDFILSHKKDSIVKFGRD